MRTKRIWFAFCTAILMGVAIVSAKAGAQSTCDVPLAVTGYDPATRVGALVRDLGPGDVDVTVAGKKSSLTRMEIDGGPKRVAIILDASKVLPDEEWSLETEMAARLLRLARPNDKFAVLLEGAEQVRGEHEPWMSPRQATAELRGLKSVRPVPSRRGADVLDTVFAASKLFDPQEFGDTIVVFGHPDGSGSRTDSDRLLDILLKRGIRLLGISFRDPLQGKLPLGFNPNKPLPPELMKLANPKLAQISAATGYFFSFYSTRVLSYPRQTELFEGYLDELYQEIAKPYRLNLRIPHGQGPEALHIEVLNPGKWTIRADDLHYPRSIYPYSERLVR